MDCSQRDGELVANLDWRYRLISSPYDPGPALSEFIGRCFDHLKWSFRKPLERHNSMRSVAYHKENCINDSGYSIAFDKVALHLRKPILTDKKYDDAILYGIWELFWLVILSAT